MKKRKPRTQGNHSAKKSHAPRASGAPPRRAQATAPPATARRVTVLLLLLVGITFFLPLAWLFFVPVILAATFVAILHPLYRWLYQHLWQRKALGALLCCLLMIIGMLLPAYALLQLAVNQAAELYRTAAPTIRELIRQGALNRWLERIEQTALGRWVLIQIDWSAVVDKLGSAAASLGTTIINRTYAGVFGLVATLLFMFFIMFYFFLDGDRLLSQINHLLPLPADYQQKIVTKFLLISRATVGGMFVIGLVQGFLGAMTLLIFGIDTWLFWGFVMLLLSIVPLLGPPVVLLPAGIIQFIVGDIWQGIGIILCSLLVVSSVDNVLRPRVVGSGARMHDLLVFISTLGGLSVFGIMGFIVGPAIASFFLAVIDIYRTEFAPQLEEFEK